MSRLGELIGNHKRVLRRAGILGLAGLAACGPELSSSSYREPHDLTAIVDGTPTVHPMGVRFVFVKLNVQSDSTCSFPPEAPESVPTSPVGLYGIYDHYGCFTIGEELVGNVSLPPTQLTVQPALVTEEVRRFIDGEPSDPTPTPISTQSRQGFKISGDTFFKDVFTYLDLGEKNFGTKYGLPPIANQSTRWFHYKGGPESYHRTNNRNLWDLMTGVRNSMYGSLIPLHQDQPVLFYEREGLVLPETLDLIIAFLPKQSVETPSGRLNITLSDTSNLDGTIVTLSLERDGLRLAEINALFPKTVASTISDTLLPDLPTTSPASEFVYHPGSPVITFRLPAVTDPTTSAIIDGVLFASLSNFSALYPELQPEIQLSPTSYQVGQEIRTIDARTITYDELQQSNATTEGEFGGIGISLGMIAAMYGTFEADSTGTTSTNGAIQIPETSSTTNSLGFSEPAIIGQIALK